MWAATCIEKRRFVYMLKAKSNAFFAAFASAAARAV
jgi:hypothetical protein